MTGSAWFSPLKMMRTLRRGRRLEHRRPAATSSRAISDFGLVKTSPRGPLLRCSFVDDRNTVTDLVDDLHLVRDER